MKFEKITGLRARPVQDQENMLEFTGTSYALSLLKKHLTLTNKSAQWQLQKTQDDFRMWSGRSGSFAEEHTERLKLQINDLKNDIETEYFVEKDGNVIAPAGFWYFAESVENDYHLQTEVEPFLLDFLRDYQKEAVIEALKYKRATVVLSTGLGKTATLTSICMSFAQSSLRTAVIVPTQELVDQVVKAIKPLHDSVTGAYSGKIPTQGQDILVCTVGTAQRYIDMYHTVIIDECLPYTQMVWTENGPVRIGKLYSKWKNGEVLPLIKSFNEKEKKFEYKRITYAWKRPSDKPLITVKASRLKITTTLNHPFLTQNRGWVKAEDLTAGDLLIGPYVKGYKQSLGSQTLSKHHIDLIVGSFLGDGHFQKVSKNRYRMKVIHCENQQEYLRWKADAFGQKKVFFIEKNGYSQKPAYAFNSFCFDFCGEIPSVKTDCPDWIIEALNPRSLAIWMMDDGSLSKKSDTIVISVCSFVDKTVEKLVNKLISMGIEAKGFKCNKGYSYIRLNKKGCLEMLKIIEAYVHPSMFYKLKETDKSKRGCWDFNFQEYATYPVNKVEINLDPSRKRGRGGGLFDLEIEDNHNFIASSRTATNNENGCGVVVHNCHHTVADTWANLLGSCTNVKYVYNLTATPFRTDGLDLAIHAFGGPTVYERDLVWGIKQGWLCAFDAYCIQVKAIEGNRQVTIPKERNRVLAYSKLSKNHNVIKTLHDYIINALEKDRKVMVLFTTLVAAKELAKQLSKTVKVDVADANYKKPLRDFQTGKCNVLIATSKLVGEGIDIPFADCLMLCTQNSSKTITYQALGRILRKSPDKKKPLVLDFTFKGYEMFEKSGKKRLDIWNEAADTVKVINKE